jgi:hypothetical protein
MTRVRSRFRPCLLPVLAITLCSCSPTLSARRNYQIYSMMYERARSSNLRAVCRTRFMFQQQTLPLLNITLSVALNAPSSGIFCTVCVLVSSRSRLFVSRRDTSLFSGLGTLAGLTTIGIPRRACRCCPSSSLVAAILLRGSSKATGPHLLNALAMRARAGADAVPRTAPLPSPSADVV